MLTSDMSLFLCSSFTASLLFLGGMCKLALYSSIKELVVGLADDPVGVAGQSPAGDGADQGLGVREGGDEERDELRQVWQHP